MLSNLGYGGNYGGDQGGYGGGGAGGFGGGAQGGPVETTQVRTLLNLILFGPDLSYHITCIGNHPKRY